MKKTKEKLLYIALAVIISFFLSYTCFNYIFVVPDNIEVPIIKKPQLCPKERENKQQSSPEYRTSYEIQAFLSSTKRITAQEKIKYISDGLKKRNIRILLPANLIYGNQLINIKKINILRNDAEYKIEDGYVDILFLQELKAGEEVTILVEYDTNIPEKMGRLGRYNNMILLTNWYPVVAPYNEQEGEWYTFTPANFGDPYFYDAVKFSGYIIVEKDWQVISPLFTEHIKHKDKYNVYFFDHKEPVRDLTFVLGKDFKCEKVQDGIVEVEYYYSSQKRNILSTAQDVLDFYGKIYGNYILDKVILVDAPLKKFFGTEYSGMVFLSTLHTVGARTIAHELGHQYWYYMVGTDQLNEPWIDESLATYSSLLYLEKLYGEKYYEKEISSLKRSSPSCNLGALTAYKTNKHYKDAAYRRYCLFWDYLRNLQGKDKLYQVLQKIQKKYRYNILYHEDLIRIINDEYGADVTSKILKKLYNNM